MMVAWMNNARIVWSLKGRGGGKDERTAVVTKGCSWR